MLPTFNGHYYTRDRVSRLFLRDDETMEPWMDPVGFLRRPERWNDLETRARAMRDLLQVELHRLLEGFINYMPVPRVWLRWGKGRMLQRRFELVAWCLDELVAAGWVNEDAVSVAQRYTSDASARSIGRQGLAELISTTYAILDASSGLPTPEDLGKIQAGRMLTQEHTAGREKRPIARLHRLANTLLKPWTLDYFVHGSYASLDACGYSDLDTLVVLKADIVANLATLLSAAHDLRKALRPLYQTDALQHHGHFVIAEQDLSYYPEVFFPLSLYDHAVSLRDDRQGQPMQVYPRDSTLEAKHAVWGICHELRCRYIESRPPRTAYERKLYLSWIMLLPALYLQATGRPCDKRESFGLAQGELDAGPWGVVEMASQKRAAWANPRPFRWAMAMMTAVGLSPVLCSAVLNHLGRLYPGSGKEAGAWLENGALFADHVLERMRS